MIGFRFEDYQRFDCLVVVFGLYFFFFFFLSLPFLVWILSVHFTGPRRSILQLTLSTLTSVC